MTQGENDPYYTSEFSITITKNQGHLLVNCKICNVVIANFDTAILPMKLEDLVRPALIKHVHRMG